MIKFWLRFFDPISTGKCPEKDYLRFLEELVRGNSLDKPNKSTKLFAKLFQKQLADNGCLGPEREIMCDRLAIAFEDDSINIELLASAIGRSEMDPSLMDKNLH